MSLVELQRASAGYDGRPVLEGISLKIDRGEKVALVGESGAGKSTLLGLLYERLNGSASLVPQELGLVNTLSVFHNVYMGRLHRFSVWRNLRNLIRPMRGEVEAVRLVLARLAMEDKLFSPAGALSGGQQQRTAVARALYQDAEVLIADEPVSAVDEHQAKDILKSINEATETVILAMHDTALALGFTDRVVALKNGRIVLDQPTRGMRPADLAGVYMA